MIKDAVSIISSDPPCKEDNTRFTTVTFKPLTVHRVESTLRVSRKPLESL